MSPIQVSTGDVGVGQVEVKRMPGTNRLTDGDRGIMVRRLLDEVGIG
jgi:hypothetical protein